jgi:putative membrane protein
MHYMRGWPSQGFAGIGGPIVMLIFGLIIVGVLVYLVIAVSRNNSGKFIGGSNRNNPGDAMGILEERFAKGEISKEDFESMRKTLQG